MKIEAEMAEETDLSRTEPASPRRLQQARSQGDVPRSAELTAWVVLLSALAALGWLTPRILDSLTQYLQSSLRSAAQPFPEHPFAAALSATSVVLPLLGVVFVAVLIAPMLLSGWVFAPRFMRFDAQRLSPFGTIKRLFSLEAVFAALKTLMKIALAGVACWLALSDELGRIFALPGMAPDRALTEAAALVLKALLAVAAALTVIAALDGGWRWRRYLARHAMTWQEVLAEARESEGSPEMRARVRSRQQQAGQGAHARPKAMASPPPPQPSPQMGEGANAGPKTIDEVGE
jgi:flagellar biosynthetic protein FlhB